jgi:hypothetical protein
MLDDWQLKQDVVALVFDTTASNTATGIRNGCASLIEKDLNHPLLWLACRHHMYEVHIKIFGSLFWVTPLAQRSCFSSGFKTIGRTSITILTTQHYSNGLAPRMITANQLDQ